MLNEIKLRYKYLSVIDFFRSSEFKRPQLMIDNSALRWTPPKKTATSKPKKI